MEFLQSLLTWENGATIIGIITAVWGGAKVIIAKVAKAVDEIEDVVTSGAKLMSETADVLNAVTAAGKPDKDGSIKITAEEWQKVKVEAVQVKQAASSFMFEIKDAWSALKAVFKKSKE